MRRTLGITNACAIVCVIAISFAGYRSTQAAAPRSDPRATVKVAIENFAFSPAQLSVAVGTTVTWTNKDSASHTVTSNSSAWSDSGTLSTGASFSHTFSKAGTYAYHCAFHSGMTASVVVGAKASSQGSTASMMMGMASKVTLKAWTGYYDDKPLMYISTDTSSKSEAAMEHINYAASLAKSLSQTKEIFFVTNGKFASRGAVFGSAPSEADYTPLWQEILVTWKNPAKATALGSDNTINALAKAGTVTLKRTGIVLNCPIVSGMHM